MGKKIIITAALVGSRPMKENNPAVEGALNVAKVAQNLDKLHHCGCGLIQYLQLIRKQE